MSEKYIQKREKDFVCVFVLVFFSFEVKEQENYCNIIDQYAKKIQSDPIWTQWTLCRRKRMKTSPLATICVIFPLLFASNFHLKCLMMIGALVETDISHVLMQENFFTIMAFEHRAECCTLLYQLFVHLLQTSLSLMSLTNSLKRNSS